MTCVDMWVQAEDYPFCVAPTELEIAESIVEATCRLMRVKRHEMLSIKRPQHVSHARQIAMYCCYEILPWSYPRIGEFFGRDHSTVIHAHKLIDRQMSEKPEWRRTVERLLREIQS